MSDENGSANKSGGIWLLAPAPGLCQVCAKEHEESEPHDITTLYFQTVFVAENGRSPVWEDGMVHCTDDVKKTWFDALESYGVPVEKIYKEIQNEI